nr:beta-ketoacyl synthase N-terminal-like domain-containing protein [Angustibacter aerolatus]
MRDVAYLVDGCRTPIGRYGGALSSVRPDDLAAHVLRELTGRHPQVDWERLDDVVLGCANQAGEDNRDVARMAVLLAGLPVDVPATTVNRLCGSGADAVAIAARAVVAGEADLVVAGGVESMSRAPLVMSKPTAAFARDQQVFDTTLGWRFVNRALEQAYGTDSMGETAENVAQQDDVSRADQDAFALRSQQRAAAARARGRFEPGDGAGAGAPATRRPGAGRRRRAPPRDVARGARPAEAGVPSRRLGHRGQRRRHQRRRRRAARRLRDRRRAVRPAAARPRRGWRGSRCRAPPDGPRAGARHAAAARSPRADGRRPRPRRA